MVSHGSNERQAKEKSIPVTAGERPTEAVAGRGETACDKGGVTRMKRNTREMRIPPHSHLGVTGAHCTMTNGVFGQKGGCSLGISFSGADLGSCCGAGEIQGEGSASPEGEMCNGTESRQSISRQWARALAAEAEE